MSSQGALARFATLLDKETHQTFTRATMWGAWLGIPCGVLFLFFDAMGLTHDSKVPALWAIFCGLYSLFGNILAERKVLQGRLRLAVLLGFILLPGLIYFVAWFSLPAGTATYITGPPSYLFMFLIVLTGFMFSPILSLLAGVIAGVEYAVAYLLARPFLAQVQAPDSIMLQDMTIPPMYLSKSLMMIFTGVVVSILANNTKKLIERILAEEQERMSLDRILGEYISPEVKEKILRDPRSMIGENRQVVVLFSDIRSFTTFSERHCPAAIVEQLNEYFGRMVTSIRSQGGLVDKFIGDAVMAVFGGLLELENPCDAAVRSALSMRAELAQLNDDWGRSGKEPFATGIGLHFGEVLQGTLGSPDRKEFTVIGDAVNTASRLEGLCKEFRHPIILSKAVYDRLSPDLRARTVALGDAQVKGREGRIEIFGINDAEGR